MRRAACALFCLLWLALANGFAFAQDEGDDEPLELTREEFTLLVEQVLAEREDAANAGDAADGAAMEEDDAEGSGGSGLDDALVSQGQTAFNSVCTTCHDADRSTQARKGFGAWVATVRRMAAKEGADISASDVEPIAAYLTSLNPAAVAAMEASGNGGAASVGGGSLLSTDSGSVPTVAAFATISPLWRGTNDEMTLENPDFFVDAWVGADWTPSGAVSARVVGCTSCHADLNSSAGFSLELVEASATIDLMKLFDHSDKHESDHESRFDATIKAGRFIVPFGAFQQLSYPGVYRTVTNPLMFNMGRRVGPTGSMQPVLPAPFADEGLNIHLGIELNECWNATLDVYAINGLQDASPRIFNFSRSYMDNNREPTVGGRVTIGNKSLKLGASLMTGNLADDATPAIPYKLAGADATLRWDDCLRLYFEYAIREGDSRFFAGQHDYTYGIVAELEAYLLENISFLVRYDTLEHRDTFFGNASQERFTYGINTSLPGGSWIALNHEHWMFAGSDVDVLAVRWTATF